MEYKIDNKNKVKRVPSRGHYDQGTVYTILDAGMVCHVSFVLDSHPFIIPTLYGRSGNTIFIHGAASSRMIRNLEQGVPVSLAVTHIDGLVLARSAFHHSMNYRSVVVYGKARLVEEARKNEALKVISDNCIAGRWEECRLPSDKELKATSVLEIEIEQASAKIRTGGPNDDKEDYNLDIWAGVLPYTTVVGEPIADVLLRENVTVPHSVTLIMDNKP